MSLTKQDEQAKAAEGAEKAQAAAVWTSDELTWLIKAIARFPGGSTNRWEQIAEYMGHTKSVKEIIAKVRSIKEKDMKETPQGRDLEDSFQRWQTTKKSADVLSGKSEV